LEVAKGPPVFGEQRTKTHINPVHDNRKQGIGKTRN
jgi:hypothetical protein